MTRIVNWFGTFSGGQGYSGSSEQTALALDRLVDVRVVGFSRVPRKEVTRQGLKLKSKPFVKGDVAFVHGFPNSFNSIRDWKFRMGFTMFETDTLPLAGTRWAGKVSAAEQINNSLDVLFVPCEWNVELFRRHGVKIPIEVLHNGVNPEQFSYLNRPQRSTFTFLQMATLTIRKNPGAVISAFSTLFRDNPNVRLILKTQSGTLGHLQLNKELGNIRIIDKKYSVKQIKDLMFEADAFVFPSRGEGFGMPPIEAMATGLPTIIAANSGMLEYADEKYNYPIWKNELAPAMNYPKDWGFVGNWYEPSYEELKTRMKEVYDNQDAAKAKGLTASEWVKECWNYDVVAQKIVQTIEKYYDKSSKPLKGD